MLDRADELVDDTPSQLGPYRIVERIGRGGMGIVYLAEQGPPLPRRVAIKLAQTALPGGRALARFESERQTLAVMNHPNIARVFDAGSAPDGRPYFVMEYVPGESITEFCDKRDLGIEARLELFLQVCAGVQHAHVNAVIHRDVKPSNILVTTETGTATPKLIDFGVAKALGQDSLSEGTLTQFGQIVGTPEYMSPEQAALDARPVDTRTDVYSLGVVLYELLVGSRPFERTPGADASLVDLCRRIREDEPERPSLRASRARGVDTLGRRLRGDLDAIVLKALAKDPTSRYASASDLAADIESHLRHRLVVARPPSVLVRWRKSWRRHRAAWTMSAALIGLAVLGAVQAFRTYQAAAQSEAVGDFLVEAIAPAEPVVTGAPSPALILTPEHDAFQRLLRKRFGDNPELLARLSLAAGQDAIKSGIGFDALRAARDFVVSQEGPESREAIDADEKLARFLANANRNPEAEALQFSALENRRRLEGPDHVDTWRSTARMAYVYKSAHKHDRAAAMFEEAVEGLKRHLGPDDPDVLSSKVSLSGSYLELGQYRETQALLEGAVERIRRVHGERDYQTYVAFYNLACANARLGNLEAALAHLHESTERGFCYPGGPLRDLHLLALHGDPRFEALERAGRLNARSTWWNHFLHAEERIRDRRFGEAESMLRDLIAASDRVDGKGFGDRASGSRWMLAKCFVRQGRFDEAEALLLFVLDNSQGAASVHDLLAQCELGRGRPELALARIALSAEGIDPERENVEMIYLEAESEAIHGRNPDALRLLARAAELGFDDFDRLENDLAFVTLRPSAEFTSVARSARKRAL